MASRVLIHRMLTEPWELLREKLDGCELSSLEIARQTGLNASMIRALRNGQSGNVHCTNWGLLLRWLLERENRRMAAWLAELDKRAA